jgi:hypothetical protein
MYGVSDGLAKERKEKEQREDDGKWKTVRDNEIREERRRKDEEKVRKLEEKLERAQRENEDRWRERDERLRAIEAMVEREASRRVVAGKDSEEQSRNKKEEVWETELNTTKERVTALENRTKEGDRLMDTEREDRGAHVRIEELVKDIAKDRAERQEFEWSVEGDKGIQDAKDSERDMEKKLEGAMEQVKILNVDLGKECTDRKALVKEAVSRIKEMVTKDDRQEFDEIMRGATVEVLGRSTTMKATGKGRIFTVPVLISCGCRNVKNRLERIVRNAGLVASFQWPKEGMEFVDKVREKVETMGFGKKEYYTRVRPVMKEGRVLVRVDTKKKEGGKFEGLAYWRVPPMDKEHWKRIIGMMEPEKMIAKQVESIGL